MKPHSTFHPLKLTVLALIAIAGFVLWLIGVVLPITLIELRYQYKHTLSNTLGVTSVRDLIYPKFTINLSAGQTNNLYYGITIPKLFIDEPVIFNVDPNNKKEYMEALKHGIAHASGTGLPGTNSQGYYFAHSSVPTFVRQFNAVFYLIHKLEVGDRIYIFYNGKRFSYEVYAKQITAPEDTAFLQYKNPLETIVLQTCWPPGTTSERLLVFAKRSP